MIKKIVIAMQAICLLGLSVHAQAADSSTSQTLRLAIGAEPTEGFDPMLGWSHGSYLLLHSPLLKQNADLSWHSDMLENYQHSEDGKEWTLTLKEGLKFSDGSPISAKDIAFTYNNAAASGGKVDMGNFAKADVINPLTVKMTLSSPQSTFINVLGSLGIVSADKYDAKKYAHNPIGAGPYRLVAFQPGQQLIVERNPYYAGPKNNFDKMVFVFLDEDAAFAAAQSGQLDIVRIPAAVATHAGDVKNMKLTERYSVENRGISFPIPLSGEKDAQGNPIGNDITSDVAVRKAINYAIDRKLLAESVLEGFAIPAYTGVEGLPWNNPQSSFKDGDLEKAKGILEEAGWKLNKDGLREKNGIVAKLTLWYASGDSTRRDLAQTIRASLKPLGIDMDLKSGSWETVERNIHANPTLFGWGGLDPMELVHNYSSKAAGVGFYNAGYYRNTTVDEHIEQALRQPDQTAAIPLWQKVDWDGKTGTGIQGDAAWAWLMNIQHLYLLNNCVEIGKSAPEIHGSWSVLNNVDEWAWTCQ
ncbi:peptide/nickel transport system substrate-binding protein [Providencia alcalifaciens]|nr:peptide/nickel transport system substrate-binding protein [Providencia alcalifaciens]